MHRSRFLQLDVFPASFGGGNPLGVVVNGEGLDATTMQRIARWKIADEGVLDDDASYLVNFQFRLDMSQLPRPMQIGAVGPRSGWNLLVARSQRLPAEHPAP